VKPTRFARDMPAVFSALLLIACSPRTLAAGELLGESEQGLINYADSHSPELAARTFERDAATARVEAAGRLEDPMAELELRDVPSDSLSLSPSRAGSTRYLISQALPFWGKRELARDLARQQSLSASQIREGAVLDVRARIAELYARRWLVSQAVAKLNELDQTLLAVEALTRARYSSGVAPQQDAIKAAVERVELTRRRLDVASELSTTTAALNALLGRPVEAELAAPRIAPIVREVSALEPLLQRVATSNPALAAQRATADGSAIAARLTKRERFPDFVLGVAPIQMRRSLEAWDVTLGFNLPLQRGRRRAAERESELMLRAELARTDELAARLSAEAAEAWYRWRTADRQAQLLRETLLKLAESNYQSALASYQVGRVDFATLLDAIRQRTTSRLDLLETEFELRVRAIELERLAGATL
jgi:outer membrane protein, heavy metal efflux system